MKKQYKIVLIVLLLGASVYLWSTDITGNKTVEVLDGYNEKEAEASFEEVKDQFPEKPQQVQATGGGMNPPHGQPGHRCDIPVGKPLSTPVQSTNSSGLLNSSPSTGMKNPAHGQPGHRCDLPVGSPLPQ